MSIDNRTTAKKVPKGMALPSFPKVEGGRDFDEEVEERIRLTHAYNSHIADSNTRTLSARGLIKTAEVESSASLSVSGLETETKNKRNKKEKSINDKVQAFTSNGNISKSFSRHNTMPITRAKFSMAKHRQNIVKLLMQQR